MSASWWARQARSLADPAGATAVRLMTERAAGQRVRRLSAAVADGARQRVRASRPTMRALVLAPGGRFEWRSVPAPPHPGPLGAVVRPLAVATCDMDRPIALGVTPFLTPLRFGHECVAEVLRVGDDVRSLSVGDRVVVPFQISCGVCAACREGRTGSCLAVPPVSMYGFGVSGGHWGGAVADELAVPYADGMLVPLPAGVTPAAAASVADNVSDAYRHVGDRLPALLARDPDSSVLVVGALRTPHPFTASVALYVALIAAALGGRDVTLVDARRGVREVAARLGVAAVEPRAARRLSAPLVVETSATPRGLAFALQRVAPDGSCSSVGSLHATSRIPTVAMYGRNVTLSVARAHVRTVIPQVLDLMTSGRLSPERVTTVEADLDAAPAALTEHVRAGHAKTVLCLR